MTKKNPHHFVKALVMGHINKEDLDWDLAFGMKTKTSNKKRVMILLDKFT